MKWITPYWLITPWVLIDSIRKYEYYKACPINFGTWYAIFSVLLLCMTLTYFYDLYGKTWVQHALFRNYFDDYHHYQLLFIISGISTLIWSVIGMFVFCVILVKDNVCFSYDEIFLFGLYFLAVLVLILIGIFFVWDHLKAHFRRTRLENARRREYCNIYERIEKDPDFRPRRYLSDNSTFLEETPLLEEDLKILKENCLKKFNVSFLKKLTNKREGEETDLAKPLCSICFANFEDGEDFLEHPVCKHGYHWDCIEVWLLQKKNCPTCKRNTRVCLIELFISKRRI